MNLRVSFKQGILLLLLGSSSIFAGCGGSSKSSSSSGFSPSSSATISVSSGLNSAGPNYQVVIARSGAATYTNYTGQPPTGQPGSGTVAASLAGQFFTNLDAIAPNPQPEPTIVGGATDTVTYSGKVIQLGASSDPQQQALYDESGAIATALGLPPKPAGL